MVDGKYSISPVGGTSHEGGRQDFTTTHWSVVVAGGQGNDSEAAVALEELCARYWYPVYAFIRRRGHSAHDAEDLTQAFFADLLDRKVLGRAHKERGRFRSFLLACLNHFLNDEWDRKNAWKRGGRHQTFSLDEGDAETRYLQEPVDTATPEALFERRWTLTLLDRVLALLRAEYQAAGNGALFETLEPCLIASPEPKQLGIWAGALNTTEAALRVALHRMRRRYGELLRREIADTVTSPEEVEPELRQLLNAVAGIL